MMLVFGFLGWRLLPNVWFLARKESVEVGVGLDDPEGTTVLSVLLLLLLVVVEIFELGIAMLGSSGIEWDNGVPSVLFL